MVQRSLRKRLSSDFMRTMPAPQVDPLAVKVMKEAGLNLRKHTPQAVNQQIVGDADLVVIMGPDVFPKAFAPRYVWDLRDPSGQPVEEYRKLRDAIRANMQNLIYDLELEGKNRHELELKLAGQINQNSIYPLPSK